MFAPVYFTGDSISDVETDDINKNALIAYVIENVPTLELSENYDCNDLKIYRFSTGLSNSPYLLDFGSSASSFSSANPEKKKKKKCVLRLNHAPIAVYSKNKTLSVRQQCELISILSTKTQIPVPTMYHYCDDAEILGKSFYILEFVDGRVFSLAGVHLPTLTKSDRTEIYHELVRVFAMIHSLDIDGGIRALLCQRPKWDAFNLYHQWQPDMDNECNQQHEEFTPIVQKFNALMKECLLSTSTTNKYSYVFDWDSKMNDCFIHGDFHMNNIIWHPTQNTILAVIDWECAAIGNPFVSLGYFGWLWNGYQTAELQHIPAAKLPYFTGFKNIADLKEWGIPSFAEFIQLYLHCWQTNTNTNNKLNHRNDNNMDTHNEKHSSKEFIIWVLKTQPNQYIEICSALQCHKLLSSLSVYFRKDPNSNFAKIFPIECLGNLARIGIELVSADTTDAATAVTNTAGTNNNAVNWKKNHIIPRNANL